MLERVEELVRRWNVVAEETLETESSFVVFGRRGRQPVVLKVVRRPCDEWLSGKVLEAFDGHGMVRVYEYVEGAVLLERLSPGVSLVGRSLEGLDEEATGILAEVIQQMARPRASLEAFVTVEDWGRGFESYLTSGDRQMPRDLVEQAQHIYLQLCATQRERRLLHGDLQHYNVLFDSKRGWVAIDPKGVVGETEYEIGASLRNPYERPELLASPDVVRRRLKIYEASLGLDVGRALRWTFAQAVLSAIWGVEDGFALEAENPSLLLARVTRSMLE